MGAGDNMRLQELGAGPHNPAHLHLQPAPRELLTPPGSGVSVGQSPGPWLPLNHFLIPWSPFIPA